MHRALFALAVAAVLAAPAAAQSTSSSSTTSSGDPAYSSLCFDNFNPPPGACPHSNPPLQQGDGNQATDVPAPPMLLLFAAAAAGLAARGRRRRTG